MSTKDLAPGPGSASAFMSQPAGDQALNGTPPSDGMKGMILGLYNGVRNAVYGYITGPAPSTGPPGEPIRPQSRPGTDEQVSNTIQGHEGTLEQPPRNHNSTFASEGDDPEDARQPAAGGEGDAEGAPVTSRRKSTWVTVLVVGVLFLIVVPGLVLGLVSRQVQWGIALSGAIGTVVGVFAGLYYHHTKRD